MTRESFPEIPQSALKSQAQPARVERVWRRLELDLKGARRSRLPLGYAWGPLLALGIFGLGVAVGERLRAPAAEVSAVAEPRPALPLPGAGPALVAQRPTAPHQHTPVPKHVRARRSSAADEAPTADTLTEAEEEPSVSVVSAPPPVEAAEWEKLAEAGDFQAAKAALDRSGGFDRAADRASAGQLMVLADVARASGKREQAVLALKRVLSAYVSAPEAPVAAWTLGNLLEQAGDAAGAGEAYATYRRLSPTGDFAEDAAARQVDAALSQGNLELGRRAMEEYAAHFPKGRRLVELRARLAALEAPAPAADAAAPTPGEQEEDDDGSESSADAPAAASAVPLEP